TATSFLEINAVLVDRRIDAFEIQVLGLRRWIVEGQCLEGANFGCVAQNGGPQPCAEIGLVVILAPLLFVIGAREAIEKLLFRKIRRLSHQVFLVSPQGDLSHLWNHAADGIAIGTDSEIFMCQDLFQLQAIDDGECALEKWLGNLESDEIVILLRRITVFGDLHHVEAELRFEMGGMVFCIPDGLSILGAQLWVLEGNGLIDGGMAGYIRGIVRERAEGEGVLISILALRQQLADEIAATNVVDQITELHAAKRIVAEVLDDGAAIGISVCFRELVLRELWESVQE